MAERKPLFIGPSGFHEEMATTDTATFGGLTLGGDITMGGYQLQGLGEADANGEALVYGQTGATVSGLDFGGEAGTNMADGSAADDAATVGQVNAASISNLSAGDGIDLVANVISTDLKSDGGLEIVSTELAVKIDDVPDTLDVTASGLAVVGLPSLFKINDVAVGASVTAANLDTLTDGSNADALHIHSGLSADSSERIERSLAVDESISVADPVYWTSTGDRVGKARADTNSKSWVVGVAKTAQATPGSNSTIVAHGEAAGILSGATPGTPYYLQSTGGIGTSVPGSSNRTILVGFAVSADDLWVKIHDFGKKAA